jgi:hypothetical protein
MNEMSPRFRLPFILPGQAQKELFHNEALLRVDLALHPAVEAGSATAPPGQPEEGQCWIVAAGATGDWADRVDRLAMWSDGGWRFLEPVAGMVVWNKAQSIPLRWTAGGWGGGEADCSAVRIAGQQVVGPRLSALPSPSGGTVIDVEARAAIAAIAAALMSHGLTE